MSETYTRTYRPGSDHNRDVEDWYRAAQSLKQRDRAWLELFLGKMGRRWYITYEDSACMTVSFVNLQDLTEFKNHCGDQV